MSAATTHVATINLAKCVLSISIRVDLFATAPEERAILWEAVEKLKELGALQVTAAQKTIMGGGK